MCQGINTGYHNYGELPVRRWVASAAEQASDRDNKADFLLLIRFSIPSVALLREQTRGPAPRRRAMHLQCKGKLLHPCSLNVCVVGRAQVKLIESEACALL